MSLWLPVCLSVSSLVHEFTIGLFDDNKETDKNKES